MRTVHRLRSGMSETGFDEDSPPVEIRYVRDGL